MSTKSNKLMVEVRQFSTRDGSEGPYHDPYAYREVKCNFKNSNMPKVIELIFHSGLINFLKADGIMITADEDLAAELFERYVGISPYKVDEALENMRSRKCPKCGCRRTKCESGYPGETFEVCTKCGEVRDTFFRLSAVI